MMYLGGDAWVRKDKMVAGDPVLPAGVRPDPTPQVNNGVRGDPAPLHARDGQALFRFENEKMR